MRGLSGGAVVSTADFLQEGPEFDYSLGPF